MECLLTFVLFIAPIYFSNEEKANWWSERLCLLFSLFVWNLNRLRQETIQLKKIYDEAERNTAAYYGNRTLTLDHVPPYSDQCTCATLPARSETTKTLHGSGEERQSLYSSIKST